MWLLLLLLIVLLYPPPLWVSVPALFIVYWATKGS
jgi:hypothetical protein